jgi:hypothetical protein
MNTSDIIDLAISELAKLQATDPTYADRPAHEFADHRAFEMCLIAGDHEAATLAFAASFVLRTGKYPQVERRA